MNNPFEPLFDGLLELANSRKASATEDPQPGSAAAEARARDIAHSNAAAHAVDLLEVLPGTFAYALFLLMCKRQAMRRASWPVDAFVFHHPATSVPIEHVRPDGGLHPEWMKQKRMDNLEIAERIDAWGAGMRHCGWVPTTADMLAGDWEAYKE